MFASHVGDPGLDLSWGSGELFAGPVTSKPGWAAVSATAHPPLGAHMIRKRRPPAALVLVALIAMIGAGCGSNAATGTASSVGNAGSGASSGSASSGASTQATK